MTYLDHAASTRVRPEVLEAMLPFYGETFANPSSAHGPGRAARAIKVESDDTPSWRRLLIEVTCAGVPTSS